MSLRLAGIAGGFSQPSKTASLVKHVADLGSERYGFSHVVDDLNDVGPSLGRAL